MNLYRENILDHYKNPRNYGKVENPEARSVAENISCGDEISLSVEVGGGVIEDIKFEGKGCAISIASASLMTEHVKGMSLDKARRLSKDDIQKMLGVEVTPARLKCALLPLEALRSALEVDEAC